MSCMKKKKKKEKDIQELLEAKQSAHNYCRHHLEGVVENMLFIPSHFNIFFL